MLPWKLRKRQILPVNQNFLSVYFSLAKFQLVSCNLSLAMIWQRTHTHELPKLCSDTLMHYQCIYQYTINASLHQLHQFRSFSCFFHLLNSFKLVHLHCCSVIRSFVAVTPSAFLLSFLNSLYPFNSFFRPSFLRSLFIPVFISSTIILFLCLANS